MKKIIKSKKGEGYFDVVVLVLCSMLVIAIVINVFPAYLMKQKVDTFATEIMRVAEIVGAIGTQTTSEEKRLKEELGIDPEIQWSTKGKVQLNQEMEVFVKMEVELFSFGVLGTYKVTLEGKASGKSEVYWK